eukprot:scaffold62053_cov55-Attheya_sp.AAC.1
MPNEVREAHVKGLPKRLYISLVLVIPSSPLLTLLTSSSPPNAGECSTVGEVVAPHRIPHVA